MAELKGSQTETNLMTAFAGESQARNRYTFFAAIARKEGLVQISKVFEETADQERAHASRFYKFLDGGEVEITAAFPAGARGSTEENLRHAAAGENHEHSEMYPAFAATARDEGFEAIAQAFEAISIAEKQHEKRFKELADNIAAGRVFRRDKSETWRCLNCGYRHQGPAAPGVCPACDHPQGYFELLGENW